MKNTLDRETIYKMVGGVVRAVTVVLARSVACDKVLASVVSHVL